MFIDNNNYIKIKIPGTTSNFGSGYDILGMSLGIWNEIKLKKNDITEIKITGEGKGVLPENKNNLVYKAISQILEIVGEKNLQFTIECKNQIPLSRGIGSSAAAIVGGLLGANYFLGNSMTTYDLFKIAVDIEGHPDNVAPALFGGMQIITKHNSELITQTVNIPKDLRCVLFIPEKIISTKAARKILPKNITRTDAIFNMSRVALLINSLAIKDYSNLNIATQDLLHQPYRAKLFPAMNQIIKGALEGGALASFLSGSGTTVIALTKGKEMSVAYEMAEAAKKCNESGNVKIIKPTQKGAYLVENT